VEKATVWKDSFVYIVVMDIKKLTPICSDSSCFCP